MESLFKVHNIDARNIGNVIKEQIVDVTITSPPYFDLKDYESTNQIGYGQEYKDYLSDLRLVFEQVYKVTKDSGTLWVVIDAFRRNGEVVPLPFDFSNKIKEIGWKLQEVIIWGKDRTVPWTHQGQMRNLFEYILIFSKSKNYNFFIDEVRDTESLKKWWVKYPERYNPRGKTPDAIWNFDIPTQGSWGSGYIKHFCPLPEEMIAQMLKLTTREGDVVLDCFSGSGAVLSKAYNMKRKYIGFELNKSYIKMFDDYLEKTGETKRKEYEIEENGLMPQIKFQKLILNLRSLKYARVFLKKLNNLNNYEVLKVYVKKSRAKPIRPNSLIVVEYFLLIKSLRSINTVKKLIGEISKKAPLSKFGIDARFYFVSDINEFITITNAKNIFVYTTQITHKFKKKFDQKDLSKFPKSEMILSKIKVQLDEKDYE